jgi:hypothetical protein
MKRLLRPSWLVLASVALVVGSAAYLVWSTGRAASANRAVARPVPPGDQEIVWLNPATNVAWERFVAAVHRLLQDRPDLGLQLVADADPFPPHTADVAELALTRGPGQPRLWFRWYKLTGDQGPEQWVQALGQRQPPPLAIIGGGSSDRARDLALALEEARPRAASPPLLLVTTATADKVTPDKGLMALYPERTFRFCFTNRQMAAAVADFIWSQEDLRPDAEPIYLVRWMDDPYSEDLFDRFHEILGPEGFYPQLERTRILRGAGRDWAWLAGLAALGGVPLGLDLEGLRSDTVGPPSPFWSMPILYSIGDYSRPNRWEAEVAELLMTEHDQHPAQRRPLLVLPATPQPARRFLRALTRIAPVRASQFVVATGDGIDFNTVFRDHNLAWPIQDLPMALVLFCHRNPVDASGFQPEEAGGSEAAPDPFGRTSTGTQDLLLFRDLVETLVEAAFVEHGLRTDADGLRQALRAGQLADGRARFTPEGDPVSGTGEFVVCLRPVRWGDHVQPRARLQVWKRSAGPGAKGQWDLVPIAGKSEWILDYAPSRGAFEKDHGDFE